ncbi:protein NO VEIN domain-containing protein [Streptomyces erythrochromogenes]|uniref:protein NO VEIN domain-containing protein n=1 Tax=Streptomyces erythrochromogenes TaxID=285574 RepID=UPI00368EFADD
MPVPPDPVLRAAARWLHRLPASGAARCRAVFTTHSEFSDITPTQYDAAYAWMRKAGILDSESGVLPPEIRIYDAAILDSGASWLPDADLLVQSPDEIPEDALRAAEVLGLEPGDAYARIGTAWGKVDTAERARVGALGEEVLLSLLRASTSATVEHVAAWSDAHGYDIAVQGHGLSGHLEVKSTTRLGRLTLYISRNEYETMLRDPAWQMIAVQFTQADDPAAVWTVPRHWISAQAPADSGVLGRWESCRLHVPPGVLLPGVPALAPLMTPGASPLLLGAPVE